MELRGFFFSSMCVCFECLFCPWAQIFYCSLEAIQDKQQTVIDRWCTIWIENEDDNVSAIHGWSFRYNHLIIDIFYWYFALCQQCQVLFAWERPPKCLFKKDRIYDIMNLSLWVSINWRSTQDKEEEEEVKSSFQHSTATTTKGRYQLEINSDMIYTLYHFLCIVPFFYLSMFIQGGERSFHSLHIKYLYFLYYHLIV